MHWDGSQRTYCADFLIENKFLIEIKPLKLHDSRLVLLKKEAAVKFCKINGFEYKLEDVVRITDNELLDLYKSGKITLIKRYDVLFKKKFLGLT